MPFRAHRFHPNDALRRRFRVSGTFPHQAHESALGSRFRPKLGHSENHCQQGDGRESQAPSPAASISCPHTGDDAGRHQPRSNRFLLSVDAPNSRRRAARTSTYTDERQFPASGGFRPLAGHQSPAGHQQRPALDNVGAGSHQFFRRIPPAWGTEGPEPAQTAPINGGTNPRLVENGRSDLPR